MAVLTGPQRSALPDSAFAYVEPGRVVNGKTPDKFRHFPVHDAAHTRNALARIAQGARFGDKAKAKVLAAAKRHGIQHNDGDSDDTGRAYETMGPEVRYIADKPEIRSVQAESGEEVRHIDGYAAVFTKSDGSPAYSRKLGGFIERVMPGAFDEALRSALSGETNVVCRYNHKDDMVLGTSLAGTLTMGVDKRGLKYDVIPPNCRADVLEYVDRGDVRYSSFAFRCAIPGEDDEWTESDWQFPLRSLHKVELVDVAPVLDPAYKDTSAASRSISGAVESLAAFLNEDPAEVRSMLEAGQAKRFFKRTDKRLPRLDTVSAGEREESRVLDDPAIAIRRWEYAEEPVPEDYVVPVDERSIRDEDEIRAAVKPGAFEQLCRKYHHGEPCVRPDGHEDDGKGSDGKPGQGSHANLCYGRHQGFPCNQPENHEGPHTPMTVASRDGEEAAEGTEQRSEESTDSAGASAVSALAKLAQTRKNLTQLPD